MPSNCPIPFAQSQSNSAPNIFNLNYTNQDFWSMKTRLIDYIQQKFGDKFNNFVESDLAIMLIENWAFIADTLSFKTDQIANEVFIDTVTELDNAFRLSRLVGFKPQPPIAARSMWIAQISNPLLQDLAITAPFPVEITFNSQKVTIELFPADANNNPIFNEDIIIPAGAIANSSIVGLQGNTYTSQFAGTGQPSQIYQLGFFPVIFDSVQVAVDGILWTQVEFFTDSNPRREFRVELDSFYTAYIIFGNSLAGLIPSSGSNISVAYRVGGGTIGNIISNFVKTETIANVQNLQFPVPVSLSNYTAGQFGYNGDAIDDIRQKLPVYLETQNRAVTAQDYKTLTDQFATPYNGKVGKSTAVLRNYGCAANVIDIYVLAFNGSSTGQPDGLIEAPNDLKVALQDYLSTVQMMTDFVCVKDGIIISVDTQIEVTMDKSTKKFQDQFNAQITNLTNSFFALVNWDYGQTLKDTDLIKKLSSVNQIQSLNITFTTNDPNNSGQIIVARFNEIIRPDTITINFTFV